MSVIVVSDELRKQLLATKGEAEFRDQEGALIGRFLPRFAIPELDMTDAEITAQLSPERKVYSTAQVLAHVKGAVS